MGGTQDSRILRALSSVGSPMGQVDRQGASVVKDQRLNIIEPRTVGGLRLVRSTATSPRHHTYLSSCAASS